MFFAAVFGVCCALLMAGLYFWRGLLSSAVAGVLWLSFAIYELLQYIRFVCSGNCGWMIDAPFWLLLLLVSAAAIRQTFSPAAERGAAEDDNDEDKY